MYKNKKLGQSIVEFAMLTPFIILVLSSILELSPMLNAYMKVEKATQAAAKTASIHGVTDSQILGTLVTNMYGMSFPQYYTGFDANTHEVIFPLYPIDGTHNCPGGYNDIFRSVEEDEPYPTKHCYAEAQENYRNIYGRTVVQIVPSRKSRVNGSWVSVNVQYNYQVYTPVIHFFADLLFAQGSNGVKVVPMYKFSTQRIE